MKLSKKSKLIAPHDRLPIVIDPISRRMFLRGAGSLLAIPFIPSLAEHAMAQTATGLDARFIFMNVTHGRIQPFWNPLQAKPVSVGTGVAAQALSSISGNLGYLIGSRFDDLRTKINMIQGLDSSAPSDHYWFPWSASEACYKNNPAVMTGDVWTPKFPYSIDYILAKSPKIYGSTPYVDALRIDPKDATHTYSFTGLGGDGYAQFAGAVGRTVASTWQAVSAGINPGGTTPAVSNTNSIKKYLIDQFLGETKTVVASSQISSTDKPLLQNFADQLFAVQQSMASVGTTSMTSAAPSCTAPTITEPTDNVNFNHRLMDIMVLAMNCGVTKVGTYHLNWASCMDPSLNLGSRYQPDVHDTIHNYSNDLASNQKYWGQALDHWGYMVRQMDAIGLLNKSVVVFTSDFSTSGRGHHGVDLPVLTAGGLNGKLATGQLISYYNNTSNLAKVDNGGVPAYGVVPGVGTLYSDVIAGRRYNEFLITIMQAAGLTPTDYQKDGGTGFGHYSCGISSCSGAEGAINGDLLKYQASSDYPTKDVNTPLPYFYKG